MVELLGILSHITPWELGHAPLTNRASPYQGVKLGPAEKQGA